MSPLMNDEQFQRQLNRLVDGELSATEYRQLLASLDSAPEGWRRCALAFLESQALSRDLLGVARDPAPRWSAMLAAANAPVTPAESARSPMAVQKPGNVVDGERPPLRRSGDGTLSAFRWAALAASWLVVFGVGWGLHGTTANHEPPRGVLKPNIRSGLALDGSGMSAAPVRTSGGGLGGPAGKPVGPGTNDPVRVPSAPHEQLVDTYVPPEYRLPPADIREDVRARGIDVREREMYLPLQLEDGQQYVVPVRELKVAPWKRPAY